MKPRSYETLEANIARVEPLIGRTMLRDIDSDTVQQVIYSLAKSGYPVSILNKSKIAIGSVLKMAAAKHFLSSVPVLNITIPSQQSQAGDKLARVSLDMTENRYIQRSVEDLKDFQLKSSSVSRENLLGYAAF